MDLPIFGVSYVVVYLYNKDRDSFETEIDNRMRWILSIERHHAIMWPVTFVPKQIYNV